MRFSTSPSCLSGEGPGFESPAAPACFGPRPPQVGPRALYGLAKSRWEIENQGFNDAKTRYGLEHIRHHHANSLLISWLLVALAMTIERLYRRRFLHRGAHRVSTPVAQPRRLWVSLGSPRAVHDTS